MTGRAGSVVLDASAVIALLRDEPGAQKVEDVLNAADTPGAVAALLSTVNLAEVHQALGPRLPDGLIGTDRADAIIQLVDFTPEHARDAAALRASTRELGLSLGDRACLALARSAELAVLTADRAWAEAGVDVEVILIR